MEVLIGRNGRWKKKLGCGGAQFFKPTGTLRWLRKFSFRRSQFSILIVFEIAPSTQYRERAGKYLTIIWWGVLQLDHLSANYVHRVGGYIESKH